jgi:ssDNA-binding Zn-finger/Zn-ribbon topoisomerase 1
MDEDYQKEQDRLRQGYQEFMEELRRKGVEKCPVCNSGTLAFVEALEIGHVRHVGNYRREGDMISGGIRKRGKKEVVSVTCDNCGHMLFFSASKLGFDHYRSLLEKSTGPAPREIDGEELFNSKEFISHLGKKLTSSRDFVEGMKKTLK